MTDVVVVVTTMPGGEDDAAALARTLVGERLAACVQVRAPMTSVYRWNGTVEQETERQIVIKTTRARVAALEVRLRALHTYEVPEFLVLSVDGGSEAYLRWVAEETALGLAG